MMFETVVAGWVAIILVSHIPFHPFDIQTVVSPLSLTCALQPFFLTTLLTFLHRDRGPLVYACIVWEFHEPWTQGLILLHYLFLSLHHCISSHLTVRVIHLIILSYLLFGSHHLLSSRGVIILSSLHGGQSCHFHYLSHGH